MATKRRKRRDPERSLLAAAGTQVVTFLVYATVTVMAVAAAVWAFSALVGLVEG